MILDRGYLFLMVTLISYLKSMHALKVTSFFFTKCVGDQQGDTLAHMYPFFSNSSNYICNSNSGALILHWVLDIKVDPCTKSIEKLMSLFGGKPSISPNISANLCSLEIPQD